MRAFKSADDLDRFVTETCEAMDELGLGEAAAVMAKVQSTAYTTRSEWLGELGATVRQIESHFRLPSSLQDRLDQIMTEVHEVWPRL